MLLFIIELSHLFKEIIESKYLRFDKLRVIEKDWNINDRLKYIVDSCFGC